MAITKEDLRDFHRFADEKLQLSGADSLVTLAGEWEATRRETNAVVDDIRQSHVDIEAGRVSSVSDTFTDIRKQLGIG